MKTRSAILAAVLPLLPLVAPVEAAAQDLVVMRRVIGKSIVADRHAYTYSDWTVTPACGDTVEKRTATCRAHGGDAVADAECIARNVVREAVERPAANHETCAKTWLPTTQGEWSSTCSSNATRRTTYTCTNTGSGAALDASACAPVADPSGPGPATEVLSGCNWNWSYTPWVSDSACSNSTRQSRSSTCTTTLPDGRTRTDGTGNSCSGMPKEATERTGVADASGCQNLARNGGFEGGLGQWTLQQGASTIAATTAAGTVRTGGGAVVFQTRFGNESQLAQTYALEAKSRYEFSFWVKSVQGYVPMNVQIGTIYSQVTLEGSDWMKITKSITTNEAEQVRIAMSGVSNGYTLYVDDVSMVKLP